jgi:hypothetical protein
VTVKARLIVIATTLALIAAKAKMLPLGMHDGGF